MVFPYFKQRELRIKERLFQDQRVYFESLVLGIASPEQIRRWAQRTLPNGSVVGEVITGKTVDYKTLKPLRNGLFCERIFGPVKDFYCSCGKSQPNPSVSFCPDCEVEYYPSTIRRHRFGYIELFSGSVHLWYFKGRPNYLSILLRKKRKNLEPLIYCTTVFVNAHSIGLVPKRIVSNNEPVPSQQLYQPGHTVPVSTNFCCDAFRQRGFLEFMISPPEEGDQTIPRYCSGSAYATTELKADETSMSGMSFKDLLREFEKERNAKVERALNTLGGQAIANFLHNLNLQTLYTLLAVEILELNDVIEELVALSPLLPSQQRRLGRLILRRLAYIRRFKLVHAFIRSKRDPAWMVIYALPVLPPTLRPISVLDNGTLVASDLNRLYQRLLHRNHRMKLSRVLDPETIGFHQRLVQDAVDAIFENGKGGSNVVVGPDNRPLRSLADRLKGKRGRFRFNLLGKRVDYSGRSVIVVGPKMQLHECGLPREMALQLFSPFVIRRLLEGRHVDNFVRARNFVRSEHPLVWPILLEIMGQYPILLNRAPTLHRLGIQAFQPRLVSTQAILLHPLVCSAFNADFDGDQMAVHIPLSFHARAEAWKLLWSRNNLLAPATGDPILAPSQDMILGSYYLTTNGQPNPQKRAELELNPFEESSADSLQSGCYFHDFEDVLQAFYQGFIRVHSPIWMRLSLDQISQNTEGPQEPEEIHIYSDGTGSLVFSDTQQRRQWSVSTNEVDFFTAYAFILSQFVRTTPGRILINQFLAGRDTIISDRMYQQVEETLSQVFSKMLEKEKEALESGNTSRPSILSPLREPLDIDLLGRKKNERPEFTTRRNMSDREVISKNSPRGSFIFPSDEYLEKYIGGVKDLKVEALKRALRGSPEKEGEN